MKRIKLIRLDEGISEEAGVYSENSREAMLEEDELSPIEDGFMKGWDEAV